jgi:hypothetical protein
MECGHWGGKLNYLGMDCAPAKSTAGDGLRNRDEDLFKQYYFKLTANFQPFLSVSRVSGVSFEQFYAFDSTTITLFSQVMKGAGRDPKGDGRKKRWFKSPFTDRCSRRQRQICYCKRSQNARQKIFVKTLT